MGTIVGEQEEKYIKHIQKFFATEIESNKLKQMKNDKRFEQLYLIYNDIDLCVYHFFDEYINSKEIKSGDSGYLYFYNLELKEIRIIRFLKLENKKYVFQLMGEVFFGFTIFKKYSVVGYIPLIPNADNLIEFKLI